MADEPFLPHFPDAPELPQPQPVEPQPVEPQPVEPQPVEPRPELEPTAPEPEPPGRELELEPGIEEPAGARPRSAADAALPWLLAVVVVVLLAASAGLISAWVVANLRAVPVPALADVTPSPGTSAGPSGPTVTPSTAASEQPRHTPTPSPLITPEPPPFVHVVQRGEFLSYIADLYGVTVEEIVALNDLRNPNRIHPGQELLIPGYGHRPSPSPG